MITADGRLETHAVPVFGAGALLYDDVFSLDQSAHVCLLHFSFFAAEGIS